jgi:hypothetical protein
MRPQTRRLTTTILLGLAALVARAAAVQERVDGANRAALAAETVAGYRDYRDSLERVLALRETEVERLARLAKRHAALAAEQVLSGAELARTREALADARAAADAARRAIVEADHLIGEALAMERLARRPPLPPGGSDADDLVVRHNGAAGWSLAGVPALVAFFEGRFGRRLPLSAVGQSAVHDRFGFDHREAVDVALHPDSPEGRALVAHLRARGIPFLAFRSAVRGAATGPHIHVGAPSPRLASGRSG